MIVAPFFAAALALVSLHEGQVVHANRPSIEIQEALDVEFNSQGSQGESMEEETADGPPPRQGHSAAASLAELAGAVMDQPAKLPQELLRGAWAVGRQLGEAGVSGAAFEYTVTCDGVACPVAVKQSNARKEAVEDVKREGQLLSKVQSHYVVKLIPPGSVPCDERKKHCFAMQFFNAGTLSSLLARKQLDDSKKAIFFWQLAKGVKDIHEKGLVHLDIKLDNAVINCEGEACYAALIDMGLAKERGETLKRGVGTLGWQAPEVSSGAACTGSMDVWSLGVLLQILFTESTPSFFVQGNAVTTNINAARKRQRELSESRGKDDPDLKRLRGSGKAVQQRVVDILEQIYVPSEGRPEKKGIMGMGKAPALPARIPIGELLNQAAGLLKLAAPDVAERVLARTPEDYGARKPLRKCLLDAPWAPEGGA